MLDQRRPVESVLRVALSPVVPAELAAVSRRTVPTIPKLPPAVSAASSTPIVPLLTQRRPVESTLIVETSPSVPEDEVAVSRRTAPAIVTESPVVCAASSAYCAPPEQPESQMTLRAPAPSDTVIDPESTITFNAPEPSETMDSVRILPVASVWQGS